MENKKLSYLVFLIVGLLVGSGSTYFLTANTSVQITSINDRQEVHSIVVIDASTWNADEVEVLVNGSVVANYLPYYWNNMLYTVGEYMLTVRVKNDGIWTEDSKTVIIPETFIVPIDYEFTEDFVVHEGQTVTFEDFGIVKIADGNLQNGHTSLDGLNYYSINVFGELILKNSILKCAIFEASGYGIVRLLNDSAIIQTESVAMYQPNGWFAGDFPSPRFNDNAVLSYDETIPVIVHSVDMISINEIYYWFMEDSQYTSLS